MNRRRLIRALCTGPTLAAVAGCSTSPPHDPVAHAAETRALYACPTVFGAGDALGEALFVDYEEQKVAFVHEE